LSSLGIRAPLLNDGGPAVDRRPVTNLAAVLAAIVAAMYCYIALGVVPRLGRGAGEQGRVLRLARWGAGVFFAGCALTHLGMAVGTLSAAGGQGEMAGMPSSTSSWIVTDQPLVSHLLQLVGGAVFIGFARGRLELSVMGKQDAERLRRQEAQFRAAFRHAPVGIGLLSVGGPHDQQLLEVNPALVAMLGFERQEDLLAANYLELISPRDRDQALAAIATLASGAPVVELEQVLIRSDGQEITADVQACLVCEDPAAPFIVAQVRDLTGDWAREARLAFLATHDTLTGVLDRRRFKEELDRVIEDRRRAGPAALLVLDLDQFKYVNDTYGHGVGDQVLVAVAEALRHRLRAGDPIGRLGGDRFGIVCTDMDHAAARSLAHDLMQAVHDDARVTVQERIVRSAVSIGVSLIPAGLVANSDHLMAEADLAMYEAKRAGRDRIWMVEAAGVALGELRSHLACTENIRMALEEGGFRMWEQPILNLTTGNCDRSELLLRMIDPSDGSIVPPGRFLAAAERFGLIQSIDRWVFGQAVRLLAIRQAAGDHRVVEVNLSGASLTDEALIDDLVSIICAAPIDPSRLIVEITETAAVRNFELARAVATRLSGLGCTFALDDFGSGFGSFYYLKHLPFQGIKIDGEFVKDLPSSRSDQLTVQAITTLARGLGKDTTAEFVQDAETVAVLRALGVGYAQGYFIGRPREVPELAGTAALAAATGG
jgi:diguanylate cyclase (GGDEF)-like protein/PAS domain S-box-containing protein